MVFKVVAKPSKSNLIMPISSIIFLSTWITCSTLRYLTDKYGEDRVCQVINFSYITPCVAVKDVGRVLGIPYNISNKISKKFVFDTFEECIANNPTLYEEYVDYKDLFDIVSKISGRVRQVSIHAGGVGIVDTKITDYMAMLSKIKL